MAPMRRPCKHPTLPAPPAPARPLTPLACRWAADRSNAWQLGNILDTATASKEKIVACMSGCLADPTIANPDAFALCVHACL